MTNSRIRNTTPKRVLPWQLKSVSRIRKDIRDWNNALTMAMNADNPANYPLQLLVNEVMNDALLTSQLENRRNQVHSSRFVITGSSGEEIEKVTQQVRNMPATRLVIEAMQDAIYHGYSLIQQDFGPDRNLVVDDIPRMNVVPQSGLFFPDYSEITGSIPYREMREYGTWILEFDRLNLGKSDFGLLNKAVPHVLMKRFAQSCWSELCEIYGIPPRYLKTNTQDTAMLNRAEQMMKDMGAAAYFIIDSTEELAFAQGVSTNGDVYKNLATFCDQQISMLISGAIIGQDTEHGNRSKDQAAQDMLWLLVQSDMAYIEEGMNTRVLPAWAKLGIVPKGSQFRFEPAEDTKQLFTFTSGLIATGRYRADPKWLADKFGVEVEEVETQHIASPDSQPKRKLSSDLLKGFFD